MDNYTKQTEIDIKQAEIDRISNSLLEMESMISEHSKCCIYRVPGYLLKGNEEFYRPQVLSIGPKFYNKNENNLGPMQECKRVYLKYFREHPHNTCRSFEPYIKFLKKKEREIRECYEEQFSLSSEEFIEMILLDVSFLIYELLLQSGWNTNTPSPFIQYKLVPLTLLVYRDIFLEENQIPLFVFEGIYAIAFGGVIPCRTFNNLSLDYISLFEMRRTVKDASDTEHLVDLWRTRYIGLDERRPMRRYNLEHNDFQLHFGSAKQLSAAGVKFESIESSSPLDITFEKGLLKLPKIYLHGSTETMWRSIMLFEQCHYMKDNELYFTEYVCFLSELIESEEDIEVLECNGIVENELGSNEEAVQLFNKITKNVVLLGDFTFSDVGKALYVYRLMPRNRFKARYFNHPWAQPSFTYAIINLIVAVLHAISSLITTFKSLHDDIANAQ